jgi:predicted RNA-binding protein with PIN domain
LVAVARYLVDGMNVIGSRPDGWWRDRDGAVRRLTASLADLAEASGDQFAVTFDGRPVADLEAGRHGAVEIDYTRRRGRDGADDRIVEQVAADSDPTSLTVVTSDRELKRRVSELGAKVEGAGTLLRRIESHHKPAS